MSNKIWRTLRTLGVGALAGGVVAAQANAAVFTIEGGVPESGGIVTPCSPCRDGAGIPVGAQGYVALNPGQTASNMLLRAPAGTTLLFTPIGSDSSSRNQFLLDGKLVFDYDQNPATPVDPGNPLPDKPVIYTVPADGIVHFSYRYSVSPGVPVPGDPSTTFNTFVGCIPNAGNPRTCDEVYIGLADGAVFQANDDHQDAGVRVSAIAGPSTLVAHEPGSFLVFPFWSIAGNTNTTICITDVQDGPFNGTATWVRLNFVCKGKKGPNPFCDAFDAHFPLTYHGTRCLDLKNEPAFVPPCDDGQGFAVAIAETPNFVPQSHNFLIGHAQIAAPNVLAEANALAVQSPAATGTALGAVSPTTGDYGLSFGPGGDYLALPTTLHGTFRASAPGAGPYTYLVVLTLDAIAAGQNPAARLSLDFWNANEVRYSTAHEFVCWDAVRLEAIDARFSPAGLGTAFGSVRLTANGNCAIPGTCPPLPVYTPTILGTLVDFGPGAALGVRNLFHTGTRATVYYPQ